MSIMSFGIRSAPPCDDCWESGECSMNCSKSVSRAQIRAATEATRHEIERRLLTKPVGRLFLEWERKLTAAWAADGRLGASDTITVKHCKAVEKLWQDADLVREEFINALLAEMKI